MNQDAYEKLFQIEKKQIKRRSLLTGIALGMLIFLLLLSGLALTAWTNQDKIAEAALEYLADNYLQDLFATFPDGYMSHNQHKVLPILDKFTNAAAAKKVTGAEFKYIGKNIIAALKDKELTYHEITDILTNMQTASKSGYNF
ncbi:hypothetical protein IID10_03385 [candidate division KSB1 bacterium]|nr:hypothetical protein [candidate division KSB1 bacterium]TDI91495.1 MAG: hypothetical protein E2O77_06475 [Caldithrix sp.]TDI92970.1 MAG: hypothetical protein E2O76_18075 [Caldithrix sp.]